MNQKITHEFFVGRKVIVMSAIPVPTCAEVDGETSPLSSGKGPVAEQLFHAHLVSIHDGVATFERMLNMNDGSVHANVVMLPVSGVSMVLAKMEKEASRLVLPRNG